MSHIKYNHVPLPTLECGRVWADANHISKGTSYAGRRSVSYSYNAGAASRALHGLRSSAFNELKKGNE